MAGHWVTGLFYKYAHANAAVEALMRLGYPQDKISLIVSEQTHNADLRRDEGNKTLEGVGLGVSVGGTTGAVVAALAAIGTTLAIPGLGLFLAGPIAAAVAGAGAGSVVGGLVGALVGTGVPQNRAELYDQGLRNGGIVLGVQALSDDEAARTEHLFDELGAERIRS
jgi:hypothetical protein